MITGEVRTQSLAFSIHCIPLPGLSYILVFLPYLFLLSNICHPHLPTLEHMNLSWLDSSRNHPPKGAHDILCCRPIYLSPSKYKDFTGFKSLQRGFFLKSVKEVQLFEGPSVLLFWLISQMLIRTLINVAHTTLNPMIVSTKNNRKTVKTTHPIHAEGKVEIIYDSDYYVFL